MRYVILSRLTRKKSMNEQIKKLVKRAGGHFDTHCLASNPVQYKESIQMWDEHIEKFAELIIVKCANIIWDEAHEKDSAEINEGGYKILDYFGIDWKAKQTEETSESNDVSRRV